MIPLLVVALWVASIAPAAVAAIALRSDGDAVWLLKTDTAADNTTTTTLRRRVNAVTGAWAVSVRLDGRVADAAILDGRLAVLREDGTWRLAWDGHSIDGPPAGGRMLRIAADGRRLWAVVRPAGVHAARLASWTPADGWQTAGPLPSAFDGPDPAGMSGPVNESTDAPWPTALGSATLGVYDGRPWLAWVENDGVRLARWDGVAWTAAAFDGVTAKRLARSVAFVSGARWPLLLVGGADGTAALWRPDRVPVVVNEAVLIPRQSGLAMAGPLLRIVSDRGGTPEVSTVDDFGVGRASGPFRLAEPGVVAPSPAELLNLVVLAMLTVAMLRSMRSPEPLPTLPPGLRVAPPGRRAAAAVIDAAPLIASAVWAFSRFDGSAEHLREQSERVFLPVFTGGLLYLIHVTASEARFGRSVGKWLLGLRVVTMDGDRPRVESIFVRNLMRSLDAFVLPALLPLLSPGGRRIGDLVAGTVVVAVDRSVAAEDNAGRDGGPA